MALMLLRRFQFLLALPACALLISAAPGCQRIPVTGNTSGGSSDTDETTSVGTTGATATTGDTGGGSDTPVYECDPVLQDCASGEKCTAVENGGKQNFYVCVGDPGGLDLFDPCTPDEVGGVDSCDPGFICIDNDEQVGLCLEHCVEDGDCTQGLCLRDPFSKIPYCALECDPFNPVCATPMGCRRDRDRFACQFPRAGDDGFILDPCLPGNDTGCGSGVVCIEGALVPGCESQGCCSPICETDDGSATAACQSALSSAAASCVPLFMSPAPGFETYGACLVPA